MVLSYSYLWKREHAKGETDGRKDRPAAVVLVRTDLGPGEIVYVLPITHTVPTKGDRWQIEIPAVIKERLGLDEAKSWVDVTELNVFSWTGYHLRPTKTPPGDKPPQQLTCLYGYLPSRFFEKVKKALDEYRLTNKVGLVKR